MNDLRQAARALEPHGIYTLFSHEAHFLDPLVPEEWQQLAASTISRDPVVWRVVDEILPASLAWLPRGLYFPSPIARALGDTSRPLSSLRERNGEGSPERRDTAGGVASFLATTVPSSESAEGHQNAPAAETQLAVVLDRFHYDMIEVDEDQRWTWRGQPVAERTRRFFLEHLGWQPAIGRFFFEFQVHAKWWDKSYLDAVVTPLVAVQTKQVEGGAAVEISTSSGQRDLLALETFRLDVRERLFCRTQSMGEVMFSDALRFRLLSTASEDLKRITVAGREWPLRWPADASAESPR